MGFSVAEVDCLDSGRHNQDNGHEVGGGGTMGDDNNFASTGPIRLKISQRCGFYPEITHNKFQLCSFKG